MTTERIAVNGMYHTVYGELSLMWDRYKNAMSRKRPDSVLRKQSFINHAVYNSKILRVAGADFLVQEVGRIVIPTHFAPHSLRGGVEAVKSLSGAENIVFVVPEDLMLQLKKAGFKILPFKVKQEFREETIEKYICFSSWRSIFNSIMSWRELLSNSFKPEEHGNLWIFDWSPDQREEAETEVVSEGYMDNSISVWL